MALPKQTALRKLMKSSKLHYKMRVDGTTCWPKAYKESLIAEKGAIWLNNHLFKDPMTLRQSNYFLISCCLVIPSECDCLAFTNVNKSPLLFFTPYTVNLFIFLIACMYSNSCILKSFSFVVVSYNGPKSISQIRLEDPITLKLSHCWETSKLGGKDFKLLRG